MRRMTFVALTYGVVIMIRRAVGIVVIISGPFLSSRTPRSARL
jgi:hypothetical protein